jgi:hypothetical protein
MAEIPATKTSLPGRKLPGTFQAARAEALFLSALQPSGAPSPDQIRRAVTTTLRRLGARGCAARVAGEFGDQPDTAVARMGWALATIKTVYPGTVGELRPGPVVIRYRELIVAPRAEIEPGPEREIPETEWSSR